MYTRDAIKFFGSRAEIARQLKTRTKSAVYQWGDLVPLLAAHELAALSNGLLRVNLKAYTKQLDDLNSKRASTALSA
jgi:hypothetical protein